MRVDDQIYNHRLLASALYVVLSFKHKAHVVLRPKGVYLTFLCIIPLLGETMVDRGHVVGPFMVLDLYLKYGLLSIAP